MKKLVLEYEGTDTLTTKLIECFIQNINESVGGKINKIENLEIKKEEIKPFMVNVRKNPF